MSLGPNKAAVLRKIDDIQLEPRPVREPGPREVVIELRSVGICGSDVAYWKKGRIGNFILESPMILGHEPSGVVAKIGAGVADLKVGDRVTLEPGVVCRACVHCKEGRYNLCPSIEFMATPPYDGALSNYLVHPADFCFKLPDNVSFDEGALCEPLSVGVHAVSRADIQIGSNVLITGAGPIGIMCLLVANAAGAANVVLVDVNEERLKLAKDMGATHTINLSHKGPDNEPLTVMKEVARFGFGVIDRSIECSGQEQALRTTLECTKSGGIVVVVGHGAPEVTVPLTLACIREVDVKGVFRYCNTWPTALALISSGKVNVKPLISQHYTLDEVEKAFTVAKDGKDEHGRPAVKVIITVNDK